VEALSELPDAAERDVHELKIRQLIRLMLTFTKGMAAPETIEATDRALALAKRSGNSKQWAFLMIARGHDAFNAGDLAAASAIADEGLELALRAGGLGTLAFAHQLQLATRHWRGDLAGAEKCFAAGLKFFQDPRHQAVSRNGRASDRCRRFECVGARPG
jgi:hypothetical protein